MGSLPGNLAPPLSTVLRAGELPKRWSEARRTGRQPATKAAPKDGGRPGAKGGAASTSWLQPGNASAQGLQEWRLC